MHGTQVAAKSAGAVDVDTTLKAGVVQDPDIDALAAIDGRELFVLVWNYHDDDVPAPDANVRLSIHGLPTDGGRVLVRHYRIDQNHSNAYGAWKQLGSPQHPTTEEYQALERAGQLQELESPRWTPSREGSVNLDFLLPRQGVSLVGVSW